MKLSSMTRRTFIKTAGVGMMVGMTFRSSTLKANPGKPNVLFFIADDMIPEMFNCLEQGRGQNLTPNLDRLAREGTITMGQHVVSPVCTPSRYNCLTGRYASRAVNSNFLNTTKNNAGQTVVEWNSFITKDDITLPKLLQKAGYKTGMVGKNHVVDVPDIYEFPDYRADPRDPTIAAKLKENSGKIKKEIQNAGFDYAASIYHNNPNFIGLGKLAVQNMDWIAKGGLDFIEQYHDNPFFLYFATTIPHGPNEPNRSWKADPLCTGDGYLDTPLDVLPPRESLPKRLKKAGLSGRGKENLLWLDDALGALLKKLEDCNVLDNTIIFFFNDHGQHAKGTLYQGGVHDPSIVWQKSGFPCGPVSHAKISNVDFAPTILDYCGISYQHVKFDGVSFLPVLKGNTDKARKSLYFELGYARGILKDRWKYIAVRYPEHIENMTMKERKRVLDAYNADRKRRDMVIVNTDPTKPFSHLTAIPGGGHAEFESTGKYSGYYDRDQLYDLQTDPGEQQNLAGNPKYQDTLSEMKNELKQYIDDLPGSFPL